MPARWPAGHDIVGFFTLYFLVTGFHALHVVLGLIILAIVARYDTAANCETGAVLLAHGRPDLAGDLSLSLPVAVTMIRPIRPPGCAHGWPLMALSFLLAVAADTTHASRLGWAFSRWSAPRRSQGPTRSGPLSRPARRAAALAGFSAAVGVDPGDRRPVLHDPGAALRALKVVSDLPIRKAVAGALI